MIDDIMTEHRKAMRSVARVPLPPTEGQKFVRLYVDGVPRAMIVVDTNPATLIEAEFSDG